MRKYAIIDYTFAGKIKWENNESIKVGQSTYYRPRCHVLYINYIQFLVFKFGNWLIEKVNK